MFKLCRVVVPIAKSRTLVRSIHTVPVLPQFSKWTKEGVDGLYSPAGFKTSWEDYQKYLTMKLTMLTVGTENETRSPFNIMVSSAKKPYQSCVYHYASQAHNNHLFFEQLIDKSLNKSLPSRLLNERIEKIFGSFEDFKNEILFEAEQLQGQGWVFLVEDFDKSLKILTCNNEGTPYFYARNQSLDLNGPIDTGDYETLTLIKEKLANKDKDYNIPILAINVWDYAYLEDYGINGKADYLEKLWECINWDIINSRLFNPSRV
ncbi:hypothetical protein PACTADRAFT_52029 [Pachysolen tannophilus NRRL Y-2460]|uniref:Manganese/iron superoxide dismutase C-terminal domain-containing protein n=1 Tax=Pachysolen tannophilus NRRL Y-2460 TaxID=669874 RepID=A0A1E4TNZ5_PACTA|nr:hypothetical protein PACTADRAFT_52029 [Pachysolen tannophilus NRRL Y-2460]